MGKDGKGDSSSGSDVSRRSRSTERVRKKSRKKDQSSDRKRRSRSPGSGAAASASESSADHIIKQLSNKMDAIKLDLSKELKAELKGVKADVASIKTTQANHDQQLGDHARAINQLLETQKQHDVRMAKSVEDAAKSARECAASMPPPRVLPPSSMSNAFDRPPNPCVIEANAHGNVFFSKVELKSVLKHLLSQKGLECDFDIPGKEVAKRFAVTCKGPVGHQMVEALLRARKDPHSGEWLHIPIKDPEGNEVKLYFKPDQSTKVKRTETITRKFAEHLRKTYTAHSFGERREDGIITVDGSRVAFIVVEPHKNTLQWNAMALQPTNIHKDDMAAYFEKTYNVQWAP
jgi:hypothetical protein